MQDFVFLDLVYVWKNYNLIIVVETTADCCYCPFSVKFFV